MQTQCSDGALVLHMNRHARKSAFVPLLQHESHERNLKKKRKKERIKNKTDLLPRFRPEVNTTVFEARYVPDGRRLAGGNSAKGWKRTLDRGW